MSVKNYIKEIELMEENQALEYLDNIAMEMRDRVLSSESDYYARGRIIYVSENGNDNNDGLSEDTPIKTVGKVQEIIRDNDTFLFKRGEMFRGTIIVKSKNVTFSAYGNGKKPVLNGSLRDYADESIWAETAWKNVWVCSETLDNVGIVHYNHDRSEYGKYHEIAGYMMLTAREKDFSGPCDLKDEYTFYSDINTKKLYIYAPDNPGKIYSSIEIGTCVNCIRGYASHMTVDNLHIQHVGAHGVQDVVGSHLTVKNCIFDWLGGSILPGYGDGSVRYGNAIECGRCDGYLVKNNWMYQIYDTGITHQANPWADLDVHQYDAMYLDNLIEYCFWSVEFYNGRNDAFDRDIRNVYICGNFCRFGGFGWGCRGRQNGAPMFASWYCCPNTQDFYVENNIFDRCSGTLISLKDDELGNDLIKFRSNAYIQPKDKRFLSRYGKQSLFDGNVKEIIAEVLGDKTSTVYALTDWHVELT